MTDHPSSGASSLFASQTTAPAVAANVRPGDTTFAPALPVAEASARKRDLLADPTFKEKLERNDPEARAQVDNIRRAAVGSFIMGPQIDAAKFGPAAVEHAKAAGQYAAEQTIDAMRNVADIPEPVADMLRFNQPVSAREQRMAQQELTRLKGDPEFVRAYLAGQRDARTRMTLCHIIVSRRVEGS